MMAGLTAPLSGKIYIGGSEITGMKENEKAVFRSQNMGYVLQGQSLLNNFTILDNICMPAYLSSQVKEFKERALELLRQIGLEEFAGEYPANLSGGEIRRVAIVRAMLNQPKVILADEPTGNLDSATSLDVMGLLKVTAQKFSQTIVMITHNEEIAQLADRIVRIEDGRIVTR